MALKEFDKIDFGRVDMQLCVSAEIESLSVFG